MLRLDDRHGDDLSTQYGMKAHRKGLPCVWLSGLVGRMAFRARDTRVIFTRSDSWTQKMIFLVLQCRASRRIKDYINLF